MRSSTSSTSIGNETDDDTSHSFKITNRQLLSKFVHRIIKFISFTFPLSRKPVTSFDSDIALGKNKTIF
jgi:hypothetical protein